MMAVWRSGSALIFINEVKGKFHYAIWSQTGSKLVADLQLVLDDRPNFCYDNNSSNATST